MTRHDHFLPSLTSSRWGAFLFEGLLLSELSDEHEVSLLDIWPEGRTTLINEACKVLPELWEIAAFYTSFNRMHEGLFEHDVVTALGMYMGHHLLIYKAMPSPAHTSTEIHYLLYKFFN